MSSWTTVLYPALPAHLTHAYMYLRSASLKTLDSDSATWVCDNLGYSPSTAFCSTFLSEITASAAADKKMCACSSTTEVHSPLYPDENCLSQWFMLVYVG